MSVATVTPVQLHDKVVSGAPVDLIDVRTPLEFREMHVTFARNVPLAQLDAARLAAQRHAAASPLYIICQSGNRSRKACEKLVAAGLSNVVNVEGGTVAWDRAGLPIVRGKKAISLERQVRIASGMLVMIGTALGAFVHPLWLWLAAVVGGGLVFAGFTDVCGMAMFLARMPWNAAPVDASRQ